MKIRERFEVESAFCAEFTGGIAEGAQVRTPCGPRRIEMVHAGDMIVTRDNGLQSVRMILKRTVTQADFKQLPDRAPVRFRPRAIGPMMPQHDLLVAPDQRVLLPGYRVADAPSERCVLVAAYEIAGTSDAVFCDTSLESVDFYQLVFDSHQVLAVNGLPMDSFLPTSKDLGKLEKDVRKELRSRIPLLKKKPFEYQPVNYDVASGVNYVPDLA